MRLKVEIPRDRFDGKRLLVATPMYGGQCTGEYLNGLLQLNTIFIRNGFNLAYFSMANESLIPKARNRCVREFMLSDCTHFMFIDADIGFRGDDVMSMLAVADPDSDKDVICGLYPKKNLHWNKIGEAARNGATDEELSECGSSLPFNPIGKNMEFEDHELAEVESCATGFMMIQRRVFEKIMNDFPDLYYIDRDPEIPETSRGQIWTFFDTAITENRIYLSEDYYFCRLARKAGMKIWVAPWVQLHHLGYYKFRGNLQTLSVPVEQTKAA